MSDGKSVLVVDGDSVQSELIAAALKASNLEVVKTEDGFEALTILREQPPAILVLDINLADPNAVELLRRFPSRNATKILGVIVPGDSDLEERCRELGVNRFIPQPFDLEGIVTAVLELLAAPDEVLSPKRREALSQALREVLDLLGNLVLNVDKRRAILTGEWTNAYLR